MCKLIRKTHKFNNEDKNRKHDASFFTFGVYVMRRKGPW